MEPSRKIQTALFQRGWRFDPDDKERKQLKAKAKPILPSEYEPDMEGWLFCPVCCTDLRRVPKTKERCSDGRAPYFSHKPDYKDIPCPLRATKPQGKRYNTYEEARRAIDNSELVIVEGFLQERPEQSQHTQSRDYDETVVEDQDGEVSELPIVRHAGEGLPLPSKIATVKGLCRTLDQNLSRYFYLPNKKYAYLLQELLKDIQTVAEINAVPGLYFGKVVSVDDCGQRLDHNIRMTVLEYSERSDVKDFTLKMSIKDQNEHGVSEEAIGRYIVAYAEVKENGLGLCFKDLRWGEYAVVPERYTELLDHLRVSR